jgi:hypothetical protein
MSLFIGAIAMAMFTAFANLEMAELFDDYADGSVAKASAASLSPFSALGRKLDAILSDAQVPRAANRWSGRYDTQALIFLCYSVSEHATFQLVVTCTILSVAVAIGVETDYGSSLAIDLVNHAAVVIFSLEICVKVGAQGIIPGTSLPKCVEKYLNDNWNKVRKTLENKVSEKLYVPFQHIFNTDTRLTRHI